MGVKDLWKLLESTGKPVSLESLEGMVLGVDVSIWLNQAVKGLRDGRGEAVPNAHLILLFHRVCKLLHWHIRPVFVFDGPTPSLKLQTLASRTRKREEASEKSLRVADKQLSKYLQAKILEQMTGEGSRVPPPVPSGAAEQDMFHLPPLPSGELSKEKSPPFLDKSPSPSTTASYLDSMSSVDIHSSDFASLPPEMQHELLLERQQLEKHTHSDPSSLPQVANAFSSYQLSKLVKRSRVSQKLEEVRKVLKASETVVVGLGEEVKVHEVETSRVVSSDTTHYILVKGLELESSSQDEGEAERVEEGETEGEEEVGGAKREEEEGEGEATRKDFCEVENGGFHEDSTGGFRLTESEEWETYQLNRAIEESLAERGSGIASPGETIRHLGPEMGVEKAGEQSRGSAICTKLDHSGDTSEDKIEVVRAGKSPPTTDLLETAPVAAMTEPEVQTGAEGTASSGMLTKTIHMSSGLPEMTSVATSRPPHSDITRVERETSQTEGAEVIGGNKDDSVLVGGTLNALSGKGESELPAAVSREESLETVCLKAADVVLVEQSQAEGDSLDREQRESGDRDVELMAEEEGEELPVTGSRERELDWREEEMAEMSELLQVSAEEAQSRLRSKVMELQQEHSKQSRAASTVSNQMYKEAQELLSLFGLPYLVSPGEAEAQCAALEAEGYTVGTITDDSDVFLFGGSRVYRHFFSQDRHVECYTSSEIKSRLGVSRQHLVTLAYLLGSDYTEGLEGVGVVSAMEILRKFPGEGSMGPLHKLRTWHKEANKKLSLQMRETPLQRKLRRITLKDDFPNPAVEQGYLHPVVDTSQELFEWGKPDLDLIRAFALQRLKWPQTRVDHVLLPVLKRMRSKESQPKVTRYFPTALPTSPRKAIGSKRLRNVVARFTHIDTEERAPGTHPTVMPRGKGKGRVGRGRGRGKGKPPSKPVSRPSSASGKRSRISSSGSSSESDRERQPTEASVREPGKPPGRMRARSAFQDKRSNEGGDDRGGPLSTSSSDSEFDRIIRGLDQKQMAELEVEGDTPPHALPPRAKGTRTHGRKRIKS